MTADDLLAALAHAMVRNDATTTKAILDVLESMLPPEELAERLEALLLETEPQHSPTVLCA